MNFSVFFSLDHFTIDILFLFYFLFCSPTVCVCASARLNCSGDFAARSVAAYGHCEFGTVGKSPCGPPLILLYPMQSSTSANKYISIQMCVHCEDAAYNRPHSWIFWSKRCKRVSFLAISFSQHVLLLALFGFFCYGYKRNRQNNRNTKKRNKIKLKRNQNMF